MASHRSHEKAYKIKGEKIAFANFYVEGNDS